MSYRNGFVLRSDKPAYRSIENLLCSIEYLQDLNLGLPYCDIVSKDAALVLPASY